MANEEKYLSPIHPGAILKAEFLEPLGMTQEQLAKDIGVSSVVVDEIVQGNRSINADIAMRLGRYFKTSAKFWLNLQASYEEDCLVYARRTKKGNALEFIKTHSKIAAVL